MTSVTTSDDVRIFYKDWGTKSVQSIVFHDGWPLSSDDWGAQMLYFLGMGYRVIVQKMRQALQRTLEMLPDSAKQDPEIRATAEMARRRSYNIVHQIYQTKIHEGHSRDYEFGLNAVRAHWQSGFNDVRRTLADPNRLDPPAARARHRQP